MGFYVIKFFNRKSDRHKLNFLLIFELNLSFIYLRSFKCKFIKIKSMQDHTIKNKNIWKSIFGVILILLVILGWVACISLMQYKAGGGSLMMVLMIWIITQIWEKMVIQKQNKKIPASPIIHGEEGLNVESQNENNFQVYKEPEYNNKSKPSSFLNLVWSIATSNNSVLDDRGKISLNKVIAREFIMILIYVVIAGIYITIAESVESYYDYQQDMVRCELREITIRHDDILHRKEIYEKLPYRLKLFYFFNFNLLSNSDQIENPNLFIEEIKKEEKSKYWYSLLDSKREESKYWYSLLDSKRKIKISIQDFREYIVDDSESEEYLFNIQSLENKYNKLNDHDFINHSTYVNILIIFIFVNILRYSFYATRWSLLQFKNNKI